MAASDQCVLCSQCLPYCPTYQHRQHESYSPRGRVALIQGLMSGCIHPSETLREVLDDCLLCRACEAHCPAKVPYYELMLAARNLLAKQVPLPLMSSTRLAFQLKLVDLPQKLLQYVSYPLAWRDYYPSQQSNSRGRVILYPGCSTLIFSRPALAAAISLVTRLGWDVYLPPDQHCCGAWFARAGQKTSAQHHQHYHYQRFTAIQPEAVITLSPLCLQHLNASKPKEIKLSILSLEEWLCQTETQVPFTFQPLEGKTIVHASCHLYYPKDLTKPLFNLLKKIPKLQWLVLPHAKQCCGASAWISQGDPGIRNTLRQEKAIEIQKEHPDFILTTHSGCGYQIAKGLYDLGEPIQIGHTAELFSRLLQIV